jgi:RimJ/RimL family protein N-acetyltransferase
MILEGRFVTLRPLTVDDAAITQKWRMGGRALLLNRGAQTVSQQAAWIAGRPDTELNYVQVLSQSGQPVGMISLVDIDLTHRHAEAAHLLIGEPELVAPYGAKIAAEATKLLYELAFDTLGLHRVYGPLSSENTKMISWNKFVGMKVEGTLRDHYWLNGRFQDAIFMGLTEQDYRTTTIPRLRFLIGD